MSRLFSNAFALFILAFACLTAGAARAEEPAARPQKRIALVMGITRIPGHGMPEAGADANAMYAALTKIGFDDPIRSDPDNLEAVKISFMLLEDRIGKAKADGFDPVVVVFISGHGEQANGSDNPEDLLLFLPSLANEDMAGRSDAARSQAILKNSIFLRDMMPHVLGKGPARVFFFISACRGFDPGLVQVAQSSSAAMPQTNVSWFMSAAPGQLSVMPNSTARRYLPGSGASPGIFTSALARYLETSPTEYPLIVSSVANDVESQFQRLGLDQKTDHRGALDKFQFITLKQQLASRDAPQPSTSSAFDEKAFEDEAEPPAPNSEFKGGRRLYLNAAAKRGDGAIFAGAKAGVGTDELLLSYAYANGLGGVTADPKASLTWAKRALVHGNRTAATQLGAHYFRFASYSRGPLKTAFEEEMFSWDLIASEGRSPAALNALAINYDDGLGTAKDRDKALGLFRQAAALKDIWAPVNLALNLLEGDDRHAPDAAGGLASFESAIKNGNGFAAYKLANIYAWGYRSDAPTAKDNPVVIAVDQAKADYYYNVALKLKEPLAAMAMANRYDDGVPGYAAKDRALATGYYQMAADWNHPEAWSVLGARYESGLGVEAIDMDKALEAHLRAAEHGFPAAYWDAAKLMYNGKTSRGKDLPGAFAAYQKIVDYDLRNPSGSVPAVLSLFSGARMNEIMAVRPDLSPSVTVISRQDLQKLYPRSETFRSFTLDLDCGGAVKESAQFFILEWDRNENPLRAQFRWYERERGCKIDTSMKRLFRVLYKIYRDNRPIYDEGKRIDSFPEFFALILEKVAKQDAKPEPAPAPKPEAMEDKVALKLATLDDRQQTGYLYLTAERSRVNDYLSQVKMGAAPRAEAYFNVAAAGSGTTSPSVQAEMKARFGVIFDLTPQRVGAGGAGALRVSEEPVSLTDYDASLNAYFRQNANGLEDDLILKSILKPRGMPEIRKY